MLGLASPHRLRICPVWVFSNCWQLSPDSQSSTLSHGSQAPFRLLPQPASGTASSSMSNHREERMRDLLGRKASLENATNPRYDAPRVVSTDGAVIQAWPSGGGAGHDRVRVPAQ